MKTSREAVRTINNDDIPLSHPDSSIVTHSIFEAMNSDKAAAFADVTLISSDFIGFPAIRTILAIRSSYFQDMFFSEFAKRDTAKVAVPVEASHLREILEFIYTDDCNLIRTLREKKKDGSYNKRVRHSSKISCKEVCALLDLAKAADYARVERLVSRIEALVMGVMQDMPHTASNTLQALTHGERSWGKQLFCEALKKCREQPRLALLQTSDRCAIKHGIGHLDDVRSAKNLFSGRFEKGTCQEELFEALVEWACGARRQLRVSSSCDNLQDLSKLVLETRLEPAKRFALSFDVSSFEPDFLEDVVEASGLVEKEALYNAYKKQALEYRNK